MDSTNTPNERKLFLDDVRPKPLGWDLVRNYNEFVEYIKTNGVPEVISFDHDLSFEHYPVSSGYMGADVPYNSYIEKTGYDCAKYLVENNFFPKQVIVHSMNPVGARNIANVLSPYVAVLIKPYGWL